MDAIDALFEIESGTENEVAGLQALINSGAAWSLQGSVGRACMEAIRAGLCALGRRGYRDTYGNYVPSRFEVKPGTKGSVEFVESQGNTIQEEETK